VKLAVGSGRPSVVVAMGRDLANPGNESSQSQQAPGLARGKQLPDAAGVDLDVFRRPAITAVHVNKGSPLPVHATWLRQLMITTSTENRHHATPLHIDLRSRVNSPTAGASACVLLGGGSPHTPVGHHRSVTRSSSDPHFDAVTVWRALFRLKSVPRRQTLIRAHVEFDHDIAMRDTRRAGPFPSTLRSAKHNQGMG